MSYVRINSSLEYDPISLMIRKDGQERPAGFDGINYAFLDEVRKELGQPPVGPTLSVADLTAPPESQSGAPGTTPPPQNYRDMFQTIQVGDAAGISYTMNPMLCASADGATEALRIVQKVVPGATLGESRFGSGGGPFAADKANYEVVLPSGARINAGHLLTLYYLDGVGVNSMSDHLLRTAILTAQA